MKRFLGILLTVAMLLTMLGTMSGCGGDPGENSGSTPDASTDNSGGSNDSGDSAFPAALDNIEAIAVPDLGLTGWTLSGGMVDGKEMEEADLQAILDACGGMMQFVFMDATNVMLTTNSTFEGTYEVVADGYAVHIQIPNYEYYGVFTQVNGMNVMIIANTTDNTTALYFSYIDEH